MSTSIKEATYVTPAENSQPASGVPCTCRICGGTMEAKYQVPLLPGRSGYWYLTCWNPCPMNGYTFTNNTYPSVNLAPYLTKEQAS